MHPSLAEPTADHLRLEALWQQETATGGVAMEAKVRAEMAQRIANHEKRNLERKLTPEQRERERKA